MTSDVDYYFCFQCNKIEPIENAIKIFKEGFTRTNGKQYYVGYCEKHKMKEIIEEVTNHS